MRECGGFEVRSNELGVDQMKLFHASGPRLPGKPFIAMLNCRGCSRVIPAYCPDQVFSCAPRTSQRMKAIAVGRSWIVGGATM